MFLNKILIKAEVLASKIIKGKDKIIDTIIDPFVPIQTNRRKIRNNLVSLFKYLSGPLSNKVDLWIDRDIISAANIISLTRALMAGPLFLIFTHFNLGIAYQMGPLSWAFISDYVDGVLARKMNQATDLGAALDAACDKIFALFVALSYFDHLCLSIYTIVNAVAFGLLDGALLTLGLMLFLAKRKGVYQGHAEVKANWLGKIKFNLQAGACFCWMYSWTIEGHYFLLGANFFALGSLIRHLSPKPKTITTG